MAAGLGFKTFTTGEVLTAADVNGYLMQGILVFASEAARNSAITSPQEGQFAFTKDNNSLWYYTGSAWVASGATGDIEGVTAGVGISGGGTSGTVTITNSMATEIDAKGDLVVGTGADTFARLPVGTNGYTLVADSSTATGLAYAAPATGGGYTELASGTGSGASLNLTSISGSYRDLVMIWRNVRPDSNGEQLLMRFNSDTTANRHISTPLNEGNQLAFTGTTFNTDPGTNSGSTNANTIKVITVYDYANTSTYKFAEILNINVDETTNTQVDFLRRVGIYNQTGAITALNFLWTGAANFSGGTYVLYGRK